MVPTVNPMVQVVTSLDWEDVSGAEPVPEPLAGLVRSRLGEGTLRWVSGVVERSLSRVTAQIQDTLAPRSTVRTLSQTIVVTILLDLVGDDSFPGDRRSVDGALSGDFVARGIREQEVTAGLRELQREWLVGLVEAAVDANLTRLTPQIAASVTTTMDGWVATLTGALEQERHRVAQIGQAQVRTAIEALIAGAPLDPTAASTVLRRPLHAWHLSCAIGAPDGVVVDRDTVDGLARSLSRRMGVSPALRYETARGRTYLWTTSEQAPKRPSPNVPDVPAPLVIGVGEPHRGPQGFRRSFREADDALQLALRCGAEHGLAYRESALAINLSRDEEGARWFVAAELGELAEDSPEMAEMRTTLRAFFAHRMRIAPAAHSLFIHRNTLINRLDRIEQRVGHPLAERTAEVQAALAVAELHLTAGARRPTAGGAGRHSRRQRKNPT